MSGAGTGRARREVVRVLKLTASPVPSRVEGASTVVERPGREARVSAAIVDALVSRGALRRDGATLARTPSGSATLRRLLSDPAHDAHAEQHRARLADRIERDGTPEPVTRNALESPLDRLAAVKERDGSPFLGVDLVEAGCRLRSDFERGALRARTTMAWEAPVSTGSGARGAAGVDLTDSAMAARTRYARAIEATGPRLGPALADFVAHEMGLTDVERRHHWPARSGKMMLREALDRLDAHYRDGR